jgi:hypothetical protein
MVIPNNCETFLASASAVNGLGSNGISISAADDPAAAVTGREQHLQVQPAQRSRVGERAPIHARQSEIRNQRVDPGLLLRFQR